MSVISGLSLHVVILLFITQQRLELINAKNMQATEARASLSASRELTVQGWQRTGQH